MVDLKRKAHKAIELAIRRGDIVRPSNCSICDKKCITRGHHEDYDKPQEVIWLCAKCHARQHREVIEYEIRDGVRYLFPSLPHQNMSYQQGSDKKQGTHSRVGEGL